MTRQNSNQKSRYSLGRLLGRSDEEGQSRNRHDNDENNSTLSFSTFKAPKIRIASLEEQENNREQGFYTFYSAFDGQEENKSEPVGEINKSLGVSKKKPVPTTSPNDNRIIEIERALKKLKIDISSIDPKRKINDLNEDDSDTNLEDTDFLMEYQIFLIDCIIDKDIQEERKNQKNHFKLKGQQKGEKLETPVLVLDTTHLMRQDTEDRFKRQQWPQSDVDLIDPKLLYPPGWETRKMQKMMFASRSRVLNKTQ
ncbi:hypothetical protein G9A89_014290 [Geosiphon pyriformis]|nr:hypothetical protein G9A89_014290 [Geosiphon pyriformis]